tara:strand:+ start:953 stop:1675 length:723 start_codon:yes stop_codon:yes gene_type:complete
MAWTVPVAWVDGTIVTATFLDAQIKGNMDFLGTSHHHATGTAGEGGGSLGPLSYMDFAIGAAPANPAATALRLYATGTKFMAKIGATANIEFSPTNHEHAIAVQQTLLPGWVQQEGGAAADIKVAELDMAVTSATAEITSTNVAIGGTGKRKIFGHGVAVVSASGAVGTVNANLYINGTQVATSQINVGASANRGLPLAGLSATLASGTYVVKYSIWSAGTAGSAILINAGIVGAEIKEA